MRVVVVDKKSIQSYVGLLGFVVALFVLSACSSSESTTWTKKASPWDHIRKSDSSSEMERQYEPVEAVSSQEANTVEVSVVADLEAAPQEVKSEEVLESVAAPVVGGGIFDIPASYYTVQLIASVDIDRVYKFADQNQLSIKYIVPTNRDGLVWHVLLLDVYPDRESAVIGKNEVESTLRTKPWVRSVGSIQQLM